VLRATVVSGDVAFAPRMHDWRDLHEDRLLHNENYEAARLDILIYSISMKASVSILASRATSHRCVRARRVTHRT